MLTKGNEADAISQPGAAEKEFLEAPILPTPEYLMQEKEAAW
jgi:hypothetical protein